MSSHHGMKSSRDFRVLHWASALEQLAIVKLLIAYGADPSSTIGVGLSAVHLAAITPHFQILEQFLDVLEDKRPEWFEDERCGQAELPAHLIAAHIIGPETARILRQLFPDLKPGANPISNGLGDMSLPELEMPIARSPYDVDAKDLDHVMQKELTLSMNAFHEAALHRAAGMDNIYAVKVFLDN
ncbi:hypothetical protein QBC41DRAFT_346921 [Cercophora samala]|uniref:Uncharacterized protein n=1 Tax=Cercophora samala TaxID=330535 RepID=A0AA40DCL9_9PEZI|nr:hypothetical protein QBC41DRAFT_346921 [Cercophora samala]